MEVLDQNKYDAEVKEKWGNTDAYSEYAVKTKKYTKEKWQSASDAMMDIFAEFADCMRNGEMSGSKKVQSLTAKLQAHITENYYTCTNEILAGLGQMYVSDERFRKNIDKCGTGTAQFAADAIAAYCRKQEE